MVLPAWNPGIISSGCSGKLMPWLRVHPGVKASFFILHGLTREPLRISSFSSHLFAMLQGRVHASARFGGCLHQCANCRRMVWSENSTWEAGNGGKSKYDVMQPQSFGVKGRNRVSGFLQVRCTAIVHFPALRHSISLTKPCDRRSQVADDMRNMEYD